MDTFRVARGAMWAASTALLLIVVASPAAAQAANNLWYDFAEPYAAATGPEVRVFDWSAQQCFSEDIPDQPARAYRDASGQVHVIATGTFARRKSGSTLGSVTHNCPQVFSSAANPDPAAWDGGEWLASTWTSDGTNVYSLIHNEYQGWRYGPGYCIRPGELWADKQKCWYNGVTLAKSTNGGASFSHTTPPTHYVASLPYRYSPGIGPSGFFTPSNIVRGRDGYLYVMVHVEGYEAQSTGSCLFRTRDVSDPKSWRAWNGTGFNVRFLDPYVHNISDPAQHVCAPVGVNSVQTGSDTLTWSTYFKKWLLVRATGGGGGTGFYTYTSDDLINWSFAKLMLNAELPWTHTCGEPDYALYPSLLDPASKSRNFETTGQRPYLFFTHFNVAYNSGGCWMSLDRDFIRVPMEFSNQQPGGPAASLAASTTAARPGEVVTFDASGSRDADGRITRFEWDLDGDGTYERDTGTSPVTQTSYTKPDSVTVTVRVSDDDGKATDETRVVEIGGEPRPAPGAAEGTAPARGAAPARALAGAAVGRISVAGRPRTTRAGTIVLRVRAPAAGGLVVRAGRIRTAAMSVAQAGIVRVRLRPTARARKILGRRGRLRVRAAIAFTPVAGVRQAQTRTLLLRARR